MWAHIMTKGWLHVDHNGDDDEGVSRAALIGATKDLPFWDTEEVQSINNNNEQISPYTVVKILAKLDAECKRLGKANSEMNKLLEKFDTATTLGPEL